MLNNAFTRAHRLIITNGRFGNQLMTEHLLPDAHPMKHKATIHSGTTASIFILVLI